MRFLRTPASPPAPGTVRTPASVLAERFSLLDVHERTAVDVAWRARERRQPRVWLERSVESARHWADEDRLPPLPGTDGWDADAECLLLHGLDSLLRGVHPYFGETLAAADDLPTAVVSTLQDCYQHHGFWYEDSDSIVLPRRHDSDDESPLVHAVVVTGDNRPTITIHRPPEGRWSGAPDEPLLTADDCATAALIGSDALTVTAHRADERWEYRVELDESVVTEDSIRKLIEHADEAGARVLALPEYATGPDVRERWERVLSDRTDGTLQWVLIGSGPTRDNLRANVAVLLSGDGRFAIEQPKLAPYDVEWAEFQNWDVADLPTNPVPDVVRDQAPPTARWLIVEAHGARLAVAVCESVSPSADSGPVTGLGDAKPTLVLCPVFSKPCHLSQWERPDTGKWSKIGADVVVTNSLVRSDWLQQPGVLQTTWTGTGVRRRRARNPRWKILHTRLRQGDSPVTALGDEIDDDAPRQSAPRDPAKPDRRSGQAGPVR